jgi:hypothetical protein
MMTGPGTNTYLVGETELAVIDPGPAIDSHVEAILAPARDESAGSCARTRTSIIRRLRQC